MTRESQYLLVLYIAEHRLSPPIPSGHIAEILNRSPSAATEMIQRLEERGIVEYEPYSGATLTESGRQRAAEVHETYVVLSWFFRDVLELDSHEQEAMEMAGLVSRPVAKRLADTLTEQFERDINPEAFDSFLFVE